MVWTAGVTALALGLAGCGGGDDSVQEVVDSLVDAAEAAQAEQDADAVEDEDAAAPAAEGLPPVPVTPQKVGAVVHYSALEYTIETLDVIDLDEEAGREERLAGVDLVFTGTVVNPTSSPAAPRAMATVEWTDPQTDHSAQASGQISDDAIPSGASNQVVFNVTLEPHHLETFEQSTALLRLGHAELSVPQIPLGADAGELVDRIPVPQEDLVGQTFDVAGQVVVTVEEADLRWDVGGSHTDEGSAVLELAVHVENVGAELQQCWNRGNGATFSLHAPDGSGTVDLSMSDRGCVTPGASLVSQTGIPVHEDYAGQYTLLLDYSIDSDDFEVPVEFTMVDGPGVLMSER